MQSVCIFVQGRLYTICFPIAIPNCKLVAILCYGTLQRVKSVISNDLRVLRVAAPYICSVAAGEIFCLPQACKDAPLGQRQGGVFRLPPPYLWTPPTPQRNNCDRRQRRKQGAVVGAAASKTRVPPKARCGCWVPQPVAKGYSPLTILKKKSKHKKASAAPVGASALTLFSLLHL